MEGWNGPLRYQELLIRQLLNPGPHLNQQLPQVFHLNPLVGVVGSFEPLIGVGNQLIGACVRRYFWLLFNEGV